MLNDNIKTLRTSKGLSQEEFAVRLNVVRQTISKWEKGLSVPDSEMLVKIAGFFEVSVGDLLGASIEPSESNGELQLIANKLEQLNAILADKSIRNRKIARCIAYCLLSAVFIFTLSVIIPFIRFASIPINPNTSSIGGVDGPTAIHQTMHIQWGALSIAAVVSIFAIIVAVILLHKGKRK